MTDESTLIMLLLLRNGRRGFGQHDLMALRLDDCYRVDNHPDGSFVAIMVHKPTVADVTPVDQP